MSVTPDVKCTARGDVMFRRDGDDLTFAWPAYRLTATLSRLCQRGGGLSGELTLTHEVAGRIHWGHLALSSVTARKTLSDKLRREIPAGDGVPNWPALLDNLCFMAVQEFRNDGTFEHVGALDDQENSDEYLIAPLLLRGELNMIFGASGVGKGYLYAGLILHAAGLPVFQWLPSPQVPARAAVLDWEWGPRELGQRLRAICRGCGAPDHAVLYRRMSGPLADAADRLRSELRRHEVDLLIIDSLHMACGSNEGGDPSETFLRLAAAVRSFGVTSLLIDHPSKGAERGSETPYGTRYKQALIRNIWLARKCHGDQSNLHVGLWHDENSNVPRFSPMGFRLLFDRESWPAGRLRTLTFHREDVRDVEGFSDLLTDAQRIERLLAIEPRTAKACAEELGKREEQVRSRLNDLRRRNRALKLQDGRWALADQRHTE